MNKNVNLPIQPLDTSSMFSAPTEIPLDKIQSGIEKTFEIKEAIVAYIDVLGFANQTDEEEIKSIFVDFPGPLAIASTKHLSMRFNVFSDNAFVAVDVSNTRELISILRYAFTQWSNDGILVRGGLALGTYNEYQTAGFNMTYKNFRGNLFWGTAITKAVKLEEEKTGAFLFTDHECAKFLQEKFNEPIIKLDKYLAIAWSDDPKILYWFTGISLLRLIKWLTFTKNQQNSITKKLLRNIHYSLIQDKVGSMFVLVLALLSLTNVSNNIRDNICKSLGINFVKETKKYKGFIRLYLQKKTELKMLQAIAETDSSLPGYIPKTRNPFNKKGD